MQSLCTSNAYIESPAWKPIHRLSHLVTFVQVMGGGKAGTTQEVRKEGAVPSPVHSAKDFSYQEPLSAKELDYKARTEVVVRLILSEGQDLGSCPDLTQFLPLRPPHEVHPRAEVSADGDRFVAGAGITQHLDDL